MKTAIETRKVGIKVHTIPVKELLPPPRLLPLNHRQSMPSLLPHDLTTYLLLLPCHEDRHGHIEF
jgi:hypothetical protein